MSSSSSLASSVVQCISSSLKPRNFFTHSPSQLHFPTSNSNNGCIHRLVLIARASSDEPELWVAASELEEEFEAMEEEMDVEEELYQFMVQSENPDLFPTKEELLAAGRQDLVDAMSGKGGWLVLGWDIYDDDDDNEGGEVEMDGGEAQAEEMPTSSGRRMEMESLGMEGILSGLEKLRRQSFGVPSVTNAESFTEEKIPLGELELSDTWEFQQTKIMKIHDKLRSIRVGLTVLEGKMTGATSEAQKPVEDEPKNTTDKLSSIRMGLAALEGKMTGATNEAQEHVKEESKNTNDANEDLSQSTETNEAIEDLLLPNRMKETKKDLSQLRIVYIVWAYPATEVLLAGSFDGWSSQRRLERSLSGSFILRLKLYPGRYQIKFIVDGVWKVDPNQPVIHSHGFVNNFLVVP